MSGDTGHGKGTLATARSLQEARPPGTKLRRVLPSEGNLHFIKTSRANRIRGSGGLGWERGGIIFALDLLWSIVRRNRVRDFRPARRDNNNHDGRWFTSVWPKGVTWVIHAWSCAIFRLGECDGGIEICRKARWNDFTVLAGSALEYQRHQLLSIERYYWLLCWSCQS